MRNRLDKKFVFIYCAITFLPDIAAFFWILILGEYRQEFTHAKLKVTMSYDNIYLIFIFSVTVFIITILLFSYFFQNKRFSISSKYSISFERGKIELYLLIIFAMNFFLLFTTGVGKAGGEYKSSPLSSLLALLNYEFFFWIYFIEYNAERNFSYYLVTVAYILLQLLQGWSSFFLTFFFCILCMSSSKWKKRLLILLPLVFLSGGAVYTIIYPYKNFIRFGKFIQVSYGEALLNLLERLTKIPNACVAIQNQEKIINLYYQFNNQKTELLSFCYPWVPGFLMKNKSKRVFSNLIMLSVYPDYSENMSAGVGISYMLLFAKLHWFYPLVYITIILLYFFVYKLLTDTLIHKNLAAINYLPFVASFTIMQGTSLRQVGLFVPAIWTFFILIFLGIIKIKRKNITEL